MSNPDSAGYRPNVTVLRCVFVAIGVLAFGLGWIGLDTYVRAKGGTDPYDVPYYDLQLFVLGADPLQDGGPYPWQLELARFLAPLVTLLTVAEAARVLLAAQWRRIRARRAREHILVCGDTSFARELADQLFAAGQRVVVIRGQPFGPLELRHRRLLGVAGNATSAAVLRGGGLPRAHTVYVCSDDDENNHSVAVAASRLLQEQTSPAWVYVQINDQEMCRSLQARRLGAAGSNRLRLDYFHIDDVAARRLYRLHPLTPVAGQQTRLLIAGDAPFRRTLLVETARFWRFTDRPPDSTLHVDLVAPDASSEIALLAERFPFLRTTMTLDAHDSEVTAWIAAGLATGYHRICLCLADEEHALDLALTTPALWRGASESVFVPLYRQIALAEAFHGTPANDLLDEVNGKLRLYPVVTRACDAGLIAEDLTERLARQIHEEYLRGLEQLPPGVVPGPAAAPWLELSDSLRSANRAQVQDIATKMLTLGCVVAPRRSGDGDPISPEQVEQLARLEHERWCRERLDQKWQYGPVRDDARRRHPDLCPWDQLTESSREKTRHAIRRLPAVLSDAGFEIVRVTGAQHSTAGNR